MPRVVHFEIPADNPGRAIKFYKDVFGWEIKNWSKDNPYWLVTTGDNKIPGGINGAITKKQGPNMVTVNTIDVPSVDEYLTLVVKSGGKVIAPKMTVPSIGYLAYCQDTEGNVFGILQPDMSAK